MARRQPLSQERIIEAAVRVADGGGLGRVSMRTVGKTLGVEAMSLYHHLAGKDALLDGLANWAFTQFEQPRVGQAWRAAMSARARSQRRVLSGHPWALGLIESRRVPGPALLEHHEAVLACLRRAGFSYPLATHAHAVLDAYVFGFVLTELNLPFGAEGEGAFAVEVQRSLPAERYPHVAELLAGHVVGKAFAYAAEFEFGLELVLDGLERHLRGEQRAKPGRVLPARRRAPGPGRRSSTAR